MALCQQTQPASLHMSLLTLQTPNEAFCLAVHQGFGRGGSPRLFSSGARSRVEPVTLVSLRESISWRIEPIARQNDERNSNKCCNPKSNNVTDHANLSSRYPHRTNLSTSRMVHAFRRPWFFVLCDSTTLANMEVCSSSPTALEIARSFERSTCPPKNCPTIPGAIPLCFASVGTQTKPKSFAQQQPSMP